jgi:MerR family transcriptional regulator, light-induced transcriptional regulator
MSAILSENIVDKYLQNLLKGNRANCSAIAHEYLAQNNSPIDLYEEVFKVALYEVGRLWENNKITVATEHLATAITEGILNELFEQIISGKKYNKKVVVACVENEQHQVGIKMVADIFELKGWESFFLGTGIPTSELVKYLHQTQPDLLAISLSVYFNFTNLLKMLEIIKVEVPDLQIILGGQAISRLANEALTRLENVIILSDLYMLDKFIDAINAKSN